MLNSVQKIKHGSSDGRYVTSDAHILTPVWREQFRSSPGPSARRLHPSTTVGLYELAVSICIKTILCYSNSLAICLLTMLPLFTHTRATLTERDIPLSLTTGSHCGSMCAGVCKYVEGGESQVHTKVSAPSPPLPPPPAPRVCDNKVEIVGQKRFVIIWWTWWLEPVCFETRPRFPFSSLLFIWQVPSGQVALLVRWLLSRTTLTSAHFPSKAIAYVNARCILFNGRGLPNYTYGRRGTKTMLRVQGGILGLERSFPFAICHMTYEANYCQRWGDLSNAGEKPGRTIWKCWAAHTSTPLFLTDLN